MTIILQNYKNLILNIIKNTFINNIDSIINKFDGLNNINNYLSLISSFDESMCSIIRNSLINLLEELDKNYSKSVERKAKYHIKSHHPRTILTIFGEITYNRTFYSSKLDGKSFCYIDRLLGLKKYDYFDPYIKAEILDYVSNHNYSETANYLNSLIGNKIYVNQKSKYRSRQTVRNIMLKEPLSIPKINKLNNTEILYIIADEKWINTQRNNGKKIMQKAIVIFDGITSKNGRNSLNNKMTFSGKTDSFIFEAIDYIENAYDTSKIKAFYILGDGASWIKNLKNYFSFNPNIEIIQALDKFHLKQCLWRILPKDDVVKTLLDYILTNKKDDFNRLIQEIIDMNIKREEIILSYKKYILNNWESILNLYKYQLSCPMESQISHSLAAYFTSRPKGYTPRTIEKLIKLRLLKLNKFNIKELFLNNINKKNIINLNEKEINYSMFDKKETYSIPCRSNRKEYQQN